MRYLVSRFVPAGSAILTILTFGSYGLGLVRDRIFAQTFGLSSQLDAYNAAFLLPDFFFNLLVASGVAAAVVPIFSRLKQRSDKAALEYIDSIISAAVLVMLVVATGLVLLAGPASSLVAPGLDQAEQALTARLMRILAVSPLLFALSNSLGAMLVARKRFFFYGLSPLLYNLGIIGGVLVWGESHGILGAAMGTLVGASLHAGVRIFDSWSLGWRPSWRLDIKTPDFRKTIRLMIPKMVGHPVELVTFWVFTALASLLTAGSISALNFARNFQSVPVSLIGITMSTAAFPLLSEAMARNQHDEYKRRLWQVLGSILVLSTSAAIVLYLVREPLISILLGGGSFDIEAVGRTAAVLSVFCLAIPTESVNHLLARSFYARENTMMPVLFSVLALVVAGGTGWLLLPSVGILALPWGFFAGSFLKTVGLVSVSWRSMRSAT